MGPFLFAEIKTGCRKAQSEGYGGVLERARSTPLRVASPESSAALGQAAAEALRVATVKAPGAWLRFESLLRGSRFRAACGASGAAQCDAAVAAGSA